MVKPLIRTCMLVALAGGVYAVVAQGPLSSLGVSEAEGQRQALQSLIDGRVYIYPARQALKSASAEGRVALVNAALTWVRAYVESPAFKAEYDKRRASAAPAAPAKKTVDEELAKQKAERDKSLAEMKENIAKMPADQRAAMEPVLKQVQEQNAKMDTDPQMAAMMRQSVEMQIAGEQREYQEAAARYEKQWPADPKVLVASRLKEFLATSADVDFDAALVTANGRQRFANPAYESRSADWKLYFRAGREPVQAAREFAQKWLTSIERR